MIWSELAARALGEHCRGHSCQKFVIIQRNVEVWTRLNVITNGGVAGGHPEKRPQERRERLH